MNTYLRQFATSLRFLCLCTLALGVLYPLVVFGSGQLLARSQADGSVVQVNGQAAASSLLAQAVPAKETRYFFPRPSAVQWDPATSGGSNLGPSDPALAKAEQKARAVIATREGVPTSKVPVDAVTSSASGLDPDISLSYARLQVPRVARATGMSTAEVDKLVADATTSPVLGLLGQPAVNTTTLNVAVAHT